MTLRALRRDVAVLVVAAAVSISFSAWIHARTCPLQAEPEVLTTQRVGQVEAEVEAEIEAEVEAEIEPAPLRYGEHFAFVVDLEEPYLVLATDVDAAWEGDFEALLGVDTVFRGIDRAALPPELRAMEGKEVALWTSEVEGRAESLGTARIGAPRLVAQAAGSLGPAADLDTWSLHERLERDGVLPDALEQRVKAAIWEEGLRLVVAPLEGARASEAMWARSAELPEPEFYAPVVLDPGHEGALQRSLLDQPKGRSAAKDHLLQGYGSLVPHILGRGWADDDGQVRLVTAFVDSPHVDACGGFDGAFSIGVRVEGTRWQPPSEIPTHHTSGPALVGDFNDDGFPDLLLEPRALDGDTSILRGTPHGYELVDELGEVPYLGCRC